MDEEILKAASEQAELARKATDDVVPILATGGKKTLSDIIKTQKQADEFMAHLRFLEYERKKNKQ